MRGRSKSHTIGTVKLYAYWAGHYAMFGSRHKKYPEYEQEDHETPKHYAQKEGHVTQILRQVGPIAEPNVHFLSFHSPIEGES